MIVRNRLFFIMVAQLSLLSFMQPVHAQNSRLRDQEGTSAYGETLNDFVTQSIVRDIASVRTECLAALPVFRLDCVRQGLELTARRAPFHGDYGPMREALRAGATSVTPIIDADMDDAADRLEVKPGSNPRFKSRRYYTPTTASSYNRTKAAAFKALDSAQSNLLEIGKRSAAWNKAYTTVSIAVGSLADVLRK